MAAPIAARAISIGLTGGLGSGKSTALELLAALGLPTLSADAVVHELLSTTELAEEIHESFGGDVVVDGAVDRAALARRVFADADQRVRLERLLWPRVRARVGEWLEQGVPPPPFAAVEVPLLFESGLEGRFDHTVTVVASERIRRERAAARGHELVDQRADVQLSQEEKAHRADFVIRNDGTVDGLRAQLSKLLARMEAEVQD